MLVLFETAAGFALFRVDEARVEKVQDLWSSFSSVESARKVVSLEKFARFKNTTDALKSATALLESKLSTGLKKFLKKNIVQAELSDKLAVSDAKLRVAIKEKLGIQTVHDNSVMELMRGIRNQIDNLIPGVTPTDMTAMSLGLAHSLSRYKLKFSPDKVDTMIVQAISLLDDLDKELNTYAMRVREWYGWHFPELARIVPDNILYAKTARKMGPRTNAASTDFSDILPEELESEVKEAAQVSMGTEVGEEDITNISALCEQVVSIGEYREQLYDYLKNRMQAIAPNLTVLVGELVGARLIAHAGSLMALAKHPASTVQILGAEKALFRALKTKHETPKYGLIYHASLIGQSAPRNKGKISRVLAAKAALAVRFDALGETESTEVGQEGRAKVEMRLRQLEQGNVKQISGLGSKGKTPQKYDAKTTGAGTPRSTGAYNAASDATAGVESKKRKATPAETVEEATPEASGKKKKRAVEEPAPSTDGGEKKKKKKSKSEDE